MNKQPLILRVTAFFLLLVFSQKIGVGLLLHNLFHDNTVSSRVFDQQHQDGKGTTNTCSCVDDLLMPFTETTETIFSKPLIIFIEQGAFIEENTSFFKPVFSFLRGPPASNV